MIVRYRLLYCLALLVLNLRANAQISPEIFTQLRKDLSIDDSTADYADVFMHIDKTVYPVTEDIWFSSYLLHARELSDYTTLYVTLINDMSGKVATSQRYVLNNGISSGCMPIPDTLESGEYSLIAYTNMSLSKKKHNYFRQAVTIIGAIKPPFDISFVKAVSGNQTDSNQVLFKVGTSYGGLASKGTIEYRLYRNDLFYGKGKQKIDAFGEAPLINVVKTSTDRFEVAGRVYRDKDTMMFKSQVLIPDGVNTISFYPEGGRLVEGTPAKVAFEIRSSSGKGISTKAFLYKDGEFAAVLESDIYGLGRFIFQPEAGVKYKVEPEDSTMKLAQNFPRIERTGYAMSVQQFSDSAIFNLSLSTPTDSTDCAILIHNRSESFAELTVRVPNGRGKLSIPATGWPAGLATISVFSIDGKLKLQSMIKVGKSAGPVVKMASDSATYLPGSKAIVKINLKDEEGKPVHGVFSVGSVLRKTSDGRKADISSYEFAERQFMQKMSVPESGYLSDRKLADNLLAMLKPYPSPVYKIDTTTIDGRVTYQGKKIRKPVEVIAAGEAVSLVNTDEQGNFRFDEGAFYGRYLSKILVSVVGKSGEQYKVNLVDKAASLNDSIAPVFRSGHYYQKDELTAQEKEQIRLLQGQTLEKVVVKANKNQLAYGGVFDSQTCNDWVCVNQIFNCRNHGPNSGGATPAVDGQYYTINGIFKLYHCAVKKEPHVGSVNAIWYDQPFAIVKPGDTAAPELFKRTTLVWAPAVQTDENGNAEISFYTNEVKGNFVVEVQGVSTRGVFSKRVEFVVTDDKTRRY